MGKLVWSPAAEQGSGVYEWAHRETMLTTKIDGSMYAIMPMNHLYAMSRYP